MPWTLQQTADYTADPVYRKRIYQAFLKTAFDVTNEDPSTPEHDARIKLANQVINTSGIPARAYEMLPVLNPALQVDGGEPTDNDILFTVAQQWNYFAVPIV